jgi:hypothetical protein
MKWKFWEKPALDLEFIDTSRSAYTHNPIVLAKDVKPHFYQHQMQKYGEYKWAHCPGMIDLKNYGYIIPAWEDIQIKANKAGVVALVGERENAFKKPKFMQNSIVDGIFKPDPSVSLNAVHIGTPWAIVCSKNISALILPAFYHSSFLDDLYVYPGLVDYCKFSSCNFIFSPKRACNIKIRAGEPMLHVIPFTNNDVRAGYGPSNQYHDDLVNSIPSSVKQFYRKYLQVNKKTSISNMEDTE